MSAANELVVTLPVVPSLPERFWEQPFRLRYLLGHGDSNTKLRKSNASGSHYVTYGLSLAPADVSGYNLCPFATNGCKAVCLNFQGHGRVFPSVQAARIAKAVAFMEERDWFLSRLRLDIEKAIKRAGDKVVALRLNVFSDIAWEKLAPELFEYPVMAYDYTAVPSRMERTRPANYHLTFSLKENNENAALAVLESGENVAVVFRQRLPRRWKGYRVINGDETDLRFLDPPNVIVGLRAKGTAARDQSGFIKDSGRRTPLPVL